MDTFVRLFVNHRPVYGIGSKNIEDAFKALTEAADEEEDGGSSQITRGKFTFFLIFIFIFMINRCTGKNSSDQRRKNDRRRNEKMLPIFGWQDNCQGSYA